MFRITTIHPGGVREVTDREHGGAVSHRLCGPAPGVRCRIRALVVEGARLITSDPLGLSEDDLVAFLHTSAAAIDVAN
jgi:hypothetical protein